MSDPVTKPDHYRIGDSGIEVLDVIDAMGWAGDFLKANALKYLLRHEAKGNPIQDLKKARYCLDRLIELKERKQAEVDAREIDAYAGRPGFVHLPAFDVPWQGRPSGEPRYVTTAGDPQSWELQARRDLGGDDD